MQLPLFQNIFKAWRSAAGFKTTDPPPGVPKKENLRLLTTPEKYARVMVYGTLTTACIVSLIAALAVPDKLDAFEAQIAAVYLTFLIGSNKAFNAKPICGRRILGAITTFTGAGLLPATIIHVAIAQIEPGQNAHAGTLAGYGIVAGLTSLLVALFSWFGQVPGRGVRVRHPDCTAQAAVDRVIGASCSASCFVVTPGVR